VYDRYLPLVDRIATRAEFSDLMWEMQGELGTSHAYELAATTASRRATISAARRGFCLRFSGQGMENRAHCPGRSME